MGPVNLAEDIGGGLSPAVGGWVNVVGLDMLLDSGDQVANAAKGTSSQLRIIYDALH